MVRPGTSDVKAWAGSAEVHERVLTEFTKSRMKRIQNDINYKLIPFLTAHGYPLNDCEFGFYTLMNKSDNTVDNKKSDNADTNQANLIRITLKIICSVFSPKPGRVCRANG